MSDSTSSKRNEKMRLCPTCRMEISALATKCRYCGEEVGRPRDESRSLTVSDLGGETIQHYAPSSSVMEALEAFRSEEDSEPPVEEAAASGILSRFSKKQEPAKPAKKPGEGLPELDERSQALSSLAMPSSRPKFEPSVVRPQRSIPRMVGVFAGLVALMVIGYFGVVQVFANRPNDNIGPTVENPAVLMLERGDDPLEALRASLDTEAMDPRYEGHKATSREARQLVLQRVNNFLNTNPWKSSDLDKASAAVGEAIRVDDHRDVQRKREEVRAERRAYSMFLDKIDSSANTATFSYREAGGEMKTVQKALGERVLDRFEIKEIRSDRVSVVDHTRKERPLTWHSNGEISSP